MTFQDHQWPGEVVHSDADIYALNHSAPQPPATPAQAPVVAPGAVTPPPGAGQPSATPTAAGNEPWDPLGQGDIGFATGAELGGKPPGSDEYTHVLTTGILNGTISNTDQVIDLAEQYGVPRSSWDASARAQFDKAFENLHHGAKLGGVGGLEFPAPDVQALRKKDVLPDSLDAAARGAVPLGLGDELGAGIDTLRFGGSFDENLHKNRAIRDYDEEHHFYERLGGEIVGGLALPTGVQGVAKDAAVGAFKQVLESELTRGASLLEAKAVAKVSARAAARQAAVQRLGVEGAGYGAAYGAGSSDGSIGDRVVGSLEGAVTGGVLGTATGAVGAQASRLIPARSAAVSTEGRQAAMAADRQGVTIFPPDVGGPTAGKIAAAIAQTPFGGPPIIAAAHKAAQDVADARDRIAAAVGKALSPEASGQDVAAGARAQFATDKSAAGNVFKAAETQAGDARVAPVKALDALDRNISELSDVPGGSSGLGTLQAIRADLAKGDHSVSAIRNMRTALRDQFMKDGLVGSDIERRVNQVVDAAQEDVVDSLNAQGRSGAADLYAKGSAMWRDLRQTEKQVLTPIIGTPDKPRAGEQIVKSIMADLQGNNARAVRLLNSLPADSQNNLRASIIGGLGKAAPGARDANNEGFSLSTFLTNWNQIGDTAKGAFFGKEARAALNDLARIAGASKATQKFQNFSNTSGNVETMRMFTYLSALPTFGISVGSQYGMGRLLASPRFARWLARMPRSTLSAPAYVDRLSRIARAEPQIANDVLHIQQRLHDAFSGSVPARLAADEPVDGTSGVQNQQQGQEEQYPGEVQP